MTYPATPGHKGTAETSRAAAQAIAPKAKTLRDRLLAHFECGKFTADEACALERVSVLSGRPRITEAARLGLLKDSGLRRKNASGKTAVVWVLA